MTSKNPTNFSGGSVKREVKVIIKFCSQCTSCPVVDIRRNNVFIGEKNNVCRLTKSQWNDLVKKIKRL